MKVESITIKNFKSIREESLEIKGKNVYLIGPNGAGKTSFIDAIWKPLTGKDMPPHLVSKNATKGFIKLDLGEFIVTLDYNAKGNSTLTITSLDGMEYKSPRTMLNEKIGALNFDVQKFLDTSQAKQIEQIKNLVGIDWTEIDAEYAELYKKRTHINSRLEELNSQIFFFDKNLPYTEINIEDLQYKLQLENKSNLDRAGVESRLQSRVERLAQIERDIENLLLEKTQILNQNTAAQEWLKSNPVIDVSQISAEINSAIEENKLIAKANEGRALKVKINDLELAVEDIQRKMDGINELKRRQLSEVKMPVPGLSFDDNQLYLNGLPFERSQINTASLIIAGLQIQLALSEVNNGQIRIAKFDGSLLDSKNLQLVEDWASENDLQLFVELVDRHEKGLKIEIKE